MKGLGCVLMVIIFIAIVTAGGICAISTSLADYGEAREQTKQVRIMADATVQVAEIQAGTAVQIAEIQADATKKTSWAFVGFWIVRAVTWAAGGVWLLVVVKAVTGWTLSN